MNSLQQQARFDAFISSDFGSNPPYAKTQTRRWFSSYTSSKRSPLRSSTTDARAQDFP